MGAQGAALAAAEQSLSTARSELDLARVTADSRAREIDRLARHAASLSSKLADATNEIDTLRIELAETVEDRDEQQARAEEIRTLSDAATARLESTVQTLESRLSSLEADLDAARRSIDAAAASEIESRDTIARLTERAASAEQERDAHAADLTSTQVELTDRRSELARLRREMADLSATLAERDRTIADMADTAAHFPVAHLPVKDQPAAAIEPAAPAHAHDDLDAQLDATRIEMNFLRQQLDRADERAARFKSRAESAEASLDKAAVLVRRARRRSAKRTEQYAGTVAAISAMRIRAENLESERDAALAQSTMGLRLAIGGGAVGLIGILLAILV
jgi:chromosome segregation protein